MPRFRFLPALILLSVTACATGGEFPSLAPRPVEQLSFEEPVKVDPPVAPDPALRARAAALLADAREGDRAFEAAYAEALPRARAAGGVGSESWVVAQVAISRVEAARTATSVALADFDRLLTDQSDDPVNDAQWEAMLRDRAAAEAIAADQTRRIDALQASVRRP